MVDAKSGQKQTLVEEGTQFKGSISSTCPVVVRGQIEGDIETPSLTVSKSGSVSGKAKVGAVISEGEIAGEFDAETVQLSGTVNNDTIIKAQSLEVKLATQQGKMQVIFGNTELEVGADPQAEPEPVAPEPAPGISPAVSPEGEGES